MFLNPFRFPQICLAPDAGGGVGADVTTNLSTLQESGNNEAGGTQTQEQPHLGAAAQDPPAAEEQPAVTDRNPPAQETKQELAEPETAEPDPAKQLEAAQQRIMAAELRSAAALAGVPKERIPYVMKLADTTGIELDADNAGEKIEAAIGKVLTDLPELRGGASGTGSTGNFARKTGEAEDPDVARIRKNILG